MGSHPVTFLWLWPATDHEPHCRHVPIQNLKANWIYSTKRIMMQSYGWNLQRLQHSRNINCMWPQTAFLCCFVSIRCGLLLPIFSGLCLCVSVCLSVTTVICAKTAELMEMSCWYGCGWAQGFPRGMGNFGGISRPIVKHMQCPACGQYSQRYSVGGSSNAAVHC